MYHFAILKAGKENSNLEELYKEHVYCMYNVAYKILRDEYLAQDAVHESFLQIFKNLDKIKANDCNKTRAFFVIIVRNVSINIYNKRKKQSASSYEELKEKLFEPGSRYNTEEIVINNEVFDKIAQKVKELRPTYADILSLKYFYYYEDREIIEILNITPENFRTRLHRAKHSLNKILSQECEVVDNE